MSCGWEISPGLRRRACPVELGADALRAGRITVLRTTETGFRLERRDVEAELLEVQIGSRFAGRVETNLVFLAPHSEVGEVVEELAEELLAIFLVLVGVQDVVVPHRIDQGRRSEQRVRVRDRKRQEHPVGLFDLCDEVRAPAFTFRARELETDGTEVHPLKPLQDQVAFARECRHVISSREK